MKIVNFLYVLGIVTLVSACSSSIPWFITETPSDPNYIFASAIGESQTMQLAIDKATVDARAEIARQVEVQLQSLQKKFDEEVGIGENSTLLGQFTEATKTVVSTALSGSKVVEKEFEETDNGYRVYVLAQYPIGAANDAFLQQIKKKEELYTRFRSSQAFEDLEKEVQKYEAWKEKQSY